MKPIKLMLKGFVGIRSGMGRDILELDLETLAGDATLIALVGHNGAGKTTVLDNLHPYRLMPSRAGAYSPGAFSFYDHVGPEAGKTLEWEHNGSRYRSTLVFKQTAKTRKTDAYLHVQTGAEWVPVTLPDNTCSDGKTDTYDRCVEHILGSPEMFFTAAFAAQGRRSLSSYSNGEIKELMSDLLGLDRIREMGAKATQVNRLLKARLDGMRGDLTRLESREQEREQAQAELAAAESDLATHMERRQQARKALNDATQRLAEAQALANTHTDAEIRRNALAAQLQAANQRRQNTLAQNDDDIRAERQRAADTRRAHETESTRLTDQINGLRQQMDQQRMLLNRKDDIAAAKQRAPELLRQENDAQMQVQALRSQAEAYHTATADRDRLSALLDSIANEGRVLSGHCSGLKTRAQLADAVPCQGTDLQSSCPLLRDAVDAKAGIAQAEQDAEAKRAQWLSARDQRDALAVRIGAMGQPLQALQDAEQALQEVQRAIRANDAAIALETALVQAECTLAQTQSQINELQALLEQKQAERERAVIDADLRIKALEQRRQEAGTAAAQEIQALQQEIDSLPAPADAGPLQAAEAAVNAADAALSAAEQAVGQINTRIATLRERMRIITREIQDAAAVKATAATLTTEIAHWSTLAKACGNDGIIALSIDDAGPTLSSIANDLLLSCYGPRFTVSIRTQAETAKGDLKETFDIVVFDGERDDEKSVRDMSGGEKIYINEALTRAVALYQAQMSGRQYHTLFADESDGALDPKRKQMFVAMKRKVLELGGYHNEIFISHTPELWEMADAVIDMQQLRA